MNRPLLFILSLLALAAPALAAAPKKVEQKKRYVVYAELIQDTPVELSDGAQWMMDKGDCFPVYMFKRQQGKIVLQLASTTFWTDADRVRIMKDSEEQAALANYRKNVENYLKSRSDRWKREMKEQR